MLLSLQTSLKCHNSWVARYVSVLDAFPDISRFVSASQRRGGHQEQPATTFIQMISSLNISLRATSVCVSLSLCVCHISYLRIMRWSPAWCPLKLYNQSIGKRCMPVDERVRSTVYYVEWRHWYFRQWSFKENAAMRPSDALEAWII